MPPFVSLPKGTIIIKRHTVAVLSRKPGARKALIGLCEQASTELKSDRMRWRAPEHQFRWYWETIHHFSVKLLKKPELDLVAMLRKFTAKTNFNATGYNAALSQILPS
ncbi:MAG TPA: hypothetical protein VHE10_03230 [Candidatus Paceibacterota bacterium]|nr:hypothetical protein [Candidatus Paceibacterota bacterium]